MSRCPAPSADGLRFRHGGKPTGQRSFVALQAVEFFGKLRGGEVLDLVLHWPLPVREIPILLLPALQDINGVVVRDTSESESCTGFEVKGEAVASPVRPLAPLAPASEARGLERFTLGLGTTPAALCGR